MYGKLYLIPTTLGNSDLKNVIPEYVLEILNKINHFIVENERTARRYLIKANINQKIDDLNFYIINKHTKPDEISNYLWPLEKGENMGIISEAGVPAIADPGSEIVKLAHQKSIKIVPLVGPSSILLALMASGMNGQNFAFNGYLPIKSHLRIKKIMFFENRSSRENQTEIFIEAPYRNHQLLKDILTACNKKTKLCIAYNLTLPDEYIRTFTIEKWKKTKLDFNKKPAIFLIYVER